MVLIDIKITVFTLCNVHLSFLLRSIGVVKLGFMRPDKSLELTASFIVVSLYRILLFKMSFLFLGPSPSYLKREQIKSVGTQNTSFNK